MRILIASFLVCLLSPFSQTQAVEIDNFTSGEISRVKLYISSLDPKLRGFEYLQKLIGAPDSDEKYHTLYSVATVNNEVVTAKIDDSIRAAAALYLFCSGDRASSILKSIMFDIERGIVFQWPVRISLKKTHQAKLHSMHLLWTMKSTSITLAKHRLAFSLSVSASTRSIYEHLLLSLMTDFDLPGASSLSHRSISIQLIQKLTQENDLDSILLGSDIATLSLSDLLSIIKPSKTGEFDQREVEIFLQAKCILLDRLSGAILNQTLPEKDRIKCFELMLRVDLSATKHLALRLKENADSLLLPPLK